MKDNKLSLDDIKNIVQFLEEHDVYEFSLERGPEKLHLKRGRTEVAAAANQPVVQQIQKPQSAAKEVKKEEPKKSAYHEVKCPMVGTFYSRPAPDRDPFVQVGQKVKKGDVICIIEAMKVMNEIESDAGGTVVEVCLEDSHVAEYDDVLIRIDTNA